MLHETLQNPVILGRQTQKLNLKYDAYRMKNRGRKNDSGNVFESKTLFVVSSKFFVLMEYCFLQYSSSDERPLRPTRMVPGHKNQLRLSLELYKTPAYHRTCSECREQNFFYLDCGR